MTARVLLFTGKGGVGKTTVAAATAVNAAAAGRTTLVLSTDPAHSLADAFDVPLGDEPASVADRLWGQQLDAADRLEAAWGDVRRYLGEVLDWTGVGVVEAEELSVLPGLDEIFSLADIRDHARSGRWDVIVVDCAPTAETIRLLSLPDVLAWYMERVFPAGRAVTRLARPLVSRVTAMPIADDAVFAAVSRLYKRLDGVHDLLTDPLHATVRLVVNPERMVVAEARRTASYLSLFGYRIDAVVANRLLPDEVCDPWFKAWKETHAEQLEAIEDGFAPIPVLRAQLASDEVVGIGRLRLFGDDLYGESDPVAVLHADEPLAVARRGSALVLSVRLPFVSSEDLDVGRRDGDLLIRVGPYRRAIALPDSLRRRVVSDARMAAGTLEVMFVDPQEAR